LRLTIQRPPDSNPASLFSQFFLTFVPCPWLDGKHVVFGEVVEGLEILEQLEANGSQSGQTKQAIVISDCGEIK